MPLPDNGEEIKVRPSNKKKKGNTIINSVRYSEGVALGEGPYNLMLRTEKPIGEDVFNKILKLVREEKQ